VSGSAQIPDWYLTDVAHCLRTLWVRQKLTNAQIGRAHRAYLAAAPTGPEDCPRRDAAVEG